MKTEHESLVNERIFIFVISISFTQNTNSPVIAEIRTCGLTSARNKHFRPSTILTAALQSQTTLFIYRNKLMWNTICMSFLHLNDYIAEINGINRKRYSIWDKTKFSIQTLRKSNLYLQIFLQCNKRIFNLIKPWKFILFSQLN